MRFQKLLLAGAASLALIGCGKTEESAGQSQTSVAAAKTNAGSPLDKTFRLNNAEEVDVDALLALLPSELRPTYESAAFDNKLGATVVSNLSFADMDDGERVTVERAEFYGVDMEAIERVQNAEGAAADAPYEKVFEKVRLLGLGAEGFEEEGAEFSIEGIEFDALSIRQGGVEGDGQGDVEARFFNAVSLAGLYFKNITLNGETEEAPAVAFSAPDIRLVGISGGKLDAIIANDVSYTVEQTDESKAAMLRTMGPQGVALMNTPLMSLIAPEKQRTAFKSMEWRGIDFSGLLEWMLKDEEPPATAHDLIDLGTVKMADMETFIDGKRAMSMKEATISAAEFVWLIPSKIRADTKGASYDFTAYAPDGEEQVLEILKDNGLDNVKSDGFAEWTWDSKKGDAQLDYVSAMDGLADFSIGFEMTGVKLSDIAAAKDEGEENPFGRLAEIKRFNIKVEDEKALDTIFALSALQMGGSGDDLRASAPTMIRLTGAQLSQMNSRISGYVNAVADFVADGGSLEITAAPEEPVPFSSLQAASAAPNTLPDVLNLEVTHKE